MAANIQNTRAGSTQRPSGFATYLRTARDTCLGVGPGGPRSLLAARVFGASLPATRRRRMRDGIGDSEEMHASVRPRPRAAPHATVTRRDRRHPPDDATTGRCKSGSARLRVSCLGAGQPGRSSICLGPWPRAGCVRVRRQNGTGGRAASAAAHHRCRISLCVESRD